MPGYPWLRAAGTVGLATVVPFTGGWVAVAAITAEHGGPSTTHSASGRVLAADSPNFSQQTASPAVVLNRSLSPSLEEVSRSAGRTPLEDPVGRMTARVQVPAGPTAQPSVKHRADSSDEPSPTAVVGGRHRAGTDQDPSTTSGDSQGSGSDSGSDSGSNSGSDSGQPQGSGSESGGSPASQDNGRHGEGGNAYGHDRAQSQGGSAYGQDNGNSGQADSSQDGAGHADSSQGSGNAYGHGSGEGQSASSGNGNGNGR